MNRAEREARLQLAIELDAAKAVPPAVGMRIQAGLKARLDGPNVARGPGLVVQGFAALVSAAVGALIVASVAHSLKPAPFELRVAQGMLQVESSATTLRGGDEVPRGDVVTASSEGATATLGAIATATLGAGSRMRVSTQTAVEVVGGDVSFQVTHRPKEQPFIVSSGDCRVTVVGTRFVVTRSERDITVAVSEGTVDVAFGAEHTFVHAGERWSSSPPAPVRPPVPPIPPAGSLFERAERLIARGDFEGAHVLYVELSASPGPDGELGLYDLSRLEAERFHRPAAALEALSAMERRYPDGALRRERMLSTIEALDALGRHAEAQKAAAQFAKSYPDSDAL